MRTEGEAMSKEQLLQELAEAYERIIRTATDVAQRGVTRKGDLWGPRETVAHLAGWEVMATVRIPHIVAGMPPLELADEAQQTVMNDAINAAFATLIGDQPLGAICDALRQAYQRDVAFLRTLDDTHFQLGQYVYARTRAAIEHCHEHIETLLLTQP
jgi:hypothetical protein